MLSCSGWNYIFDVVFDVFLRETARTAAKSRTNVSTNSGKANNGWTHWQHIWHTCADSPGNGYTLNKLPLETQGGTRGCCRVRAGIIIFDVYMLFLACFCARQRTQRLRAELTLAQIREKLPKRMDRLATHLAHICRFTCEWIYAKQVAPRDTRGHLGGFRGSTIKKSWEAVKRLDRLAPPLVHVCRFIWELTWLKTIRPTVPQGGTLGGGGGLGGQQFKILGNVVKRLERLGINVAHIMQMNLGMDTG